MIKSKKQTGKAFCLSCGKKYNSKSVKDKFCPKCLKAFAIKETVDKIEFHAESIKSLLKNNDKQ